MLKYQVGGTAGFRTEDNMDYGQLADDRFEKLKKIFETEQIQVANGGTTENPLLVFKILRTSKYIKFSSKRLSKEDKDWWCHVLAVQFGELDSESFSEGVRSVRIPMLQSLGLKPFLEK